MGGLRRDWAIALVGWREGGPGSLAAPARAVAALRQPVKCSARLSVSFARRRRQAGRLPAAWGARERLGRAPPCRRPAAWLGGGCFTRRG